MMTKTILSLLSLSLLTSSCSSFSAKKEAQIYTFESDANGFNTKNFFYDNGEEVVAFDSQFTPELARQSIAFLKTKTNHPITHLVITHPNPDKFNGMDEFKKIGARVISSQATANALEGVNAYKKYYFVEIAKMFTNENYPNLGAVDSVFEKSEEIKLGNGEVIKLQEFNKPGVSSNQTVAFIPKINTLLVGDLIHHKAHAWLEGGIVGGKATPTIDSWISLLKHIKREFVTNPMVLGGRGESVKLDNAVSAQVKYLESADKIITQYVQSHSELNYSDVQKIMEKAFPEYMLGYMIGYGAYGLAESKR